MRKSHEVRNSYDLIYAAYHTADQDPALGRAKAILNTWCQYCEDRKRR